MDGHVSDLELNCQSQSWVPYPFRALGIYQIRWYIFLSLGMSEVGWPVPFLCRFDFPGRKLPGTHSLLGEQGDGRCDWPDRESNPGRLRRRPMPYPLGHPVPLGKPLGDEKIPFRCVFLNFLCQCQCQAGLR